jgi:hypothetical protein
MEHKSSGMGAMALQDLCHEHQNGGAGRDGDLLLTWARMVCCGFAWYEAGCGLWSAMNADGPRNSVVPFKHAGRAGARPAVGTRSPGRKATVIPFVRRHGQGGARLLT